MIRTILVWTGIFVAAFALQSGCAPLISIFAIKPDLLMICLFLLCMRFGVMTGLWVGFFLGLLLDLYSPAILGQNALAASCTGFFLGLFNERVMRTDLGVKTVLMIMAFVVYDMLFIGVEVTRGGATLSATVLGLLTKTMPRALYTAALFVLFSAVRRALGLPAARDYA